MVRSKEDPMLLSRKLFHCGCVALLLLPFLSCGSAHDSDEHYVFVAANLQVPYWQAAGAGFSKAAEASKIRVSFVGPQTYETKAERDALDQAVQKKATGILLAVTDPALLKDSIDTAVGAGIPVLTIDSDAPCQQAALFHWHEQLPGWPHWRRTSGAGT
jgi:ribose transport system substrate-binding protein